MRAMSRSVLLFRPPPRGAARRPAGVALRPNPPRGGGPADALAALLLHPVKRPWEGNLMPDGESRYFGNESAWVARWAAKPEEIEALERRPARAKLYSAKVVKARLGEFTGEPTLGFALRHLDERGDRAVFESDGDEVVKSFGALRTVCQVLRAPWDDVSVTPDGDACLWQGGRLAAVITADPAGSDGELDEILDGDDEEGGDDDVVRESGGGTSHYRRAGGAPTADQLDPRRYGPEDLNDMLWEELSEGPATNLDDIPGIFPDVGTRGMASVFLYGVSAFDDDFIEMDVNFTVTPADPADPQKLGLSVEGFSSLAEFYADLSAKSEGDVAEGEVGASVNMAQLEQMGLETRAAHAATEGLHGVTTIYAGGFPGAVVSRSTDGVVVAWTATAEEAHYLRDQGNAGRRDPRFSGLASGAERIVDPSGTLDEARIAAHFPEGSVVVLDSGVPERPTFIGHFQVCGGALWALDNVAVPAAYIHYAPGEGEVLVLPPEPLGWRAWSEMFFDRFGIAPVVTAATLDPVFPARYGAPYRSAGPGRAPIRLPSPPPAGPAWPRTAQGLDVGGARGLPSRSGLAPDPGSAELARARQGGPGPIARGPARLMRDLYTGEALTVVDGTRGVAAPPDMDHTLPAWYHQESGSLQYAPQGGGPNVAARAVAASSGAGLLLLPAAPAASGYVEMHAAVPIAAPPELRLRDLTNGAVYALPADVQLPAAPAQMDLAREAWQGPDGWIRYTDLGGAPAAAVLPMTPAVAAAWPLLVAVGGPDPRGGYPLHAVAVVREAP